MSRKIGFHHSDETKRKMSISNRKIITKTRFQLGHKINSGRCQSVEEKRKRSLMMKTNNPMMNKEIVQKVVNIRHANKSYHHNEETKNKISLSQKGIKKKPFTIEHKLNLSLCRIGMKFSESHIKNLIEVRKNRVIPIKDTSIEVKIQSYLKQLGYEFFTHQYMKEIKHGYQCDILIPSINLVIECDGNYWHNYPIGRDIDHIRTKELLEKGFKVLRLWEVEIRKITVDELRNKIGVIICHLN